MDKMNRKKDENLKMNEWMSKEYIKEADKIVQEVLSKEDVLPDDQIDVQGSYEKLIAEMKVQGIYRDENGTAKSEEQKSKEPKAAEIKKAEEKTTEKKTAQEKKHGKLTRKMTKAAAFLLVVGISVFAGSMTSEANRNYLIDNFNMLIGNDMQVTVSNSNEQDIVDTAENVAIDEIEEKLSVNVPTFLYRPAKLKYDSYYIDETAQNAHLSYLYGDWIINLHLQISGDETAGSLSTHGDVDELIPVLSEKNLKVKLYKIQSENDQEPSYMAQWKIDNVYYQLSGKIDYSELKKMIEQMVIIY